MATMSVEKRIERIEAVLEIENLINRYEYLKDTGYQDEVMELFALKTPGVSAEMVWGVYDGPEGIRKLYPGLHARRTPEERKGHMTMFPRTTGVIEVARDGKTAKGLWYSPGMSAGVGDDGKPHANWTWEKYAVDFVKEDGQWKIWHLHIDCDFAIPFGKDFAEHDWPRVQSEPQGFAKPTRMEPKPYKRYSPTRLFQFTPVPPEPYDTFNEEDAY